MIPKSFALISALFVGLLWGSVGGCPNISRGRFFPAIALRESTPESVNFYCGALQASNDSEALEVLPVFQLTRSQDISPGQWKLPLWWLLFGFCLGSLGLFFWTLQRSQQDFLAELVERRRQFQPLQDHLRDRGLATNASLKPKIPEPAFAPNFPKDEVLLLQIQGLRNSQTRKKVIWGLARSGDSQAIQPLIELMTESDAQERRLILAALSQIGGRVLEQINQVLALSWQELDPQARRNAAQDLSRLYKVFSQMSQLLTDAAYDRDQSVQKTARTPLFR